MRALVHASCFVLSVPTPLVYGVPHSVWGTPIQVYPTTGFVVALVFVVAFVSRVSHWCSHGDVPVNDVTARDCVQAKVDFTQSAQEILPSRQ